MATRKRTYKRKPVSRRKPVTRKGVSRKKKGLKGFWNRWCAM